MDFYCSGMMYNYFSHVGGFPIKHNEEGKDIQNKILNNIPHFIINRLHFDCLQYGFVLYKDKVLASKREVIPPIPDSMIAVYFFQKNKLFINFTNEDMTSKFESFSKKKWMQYI